MGSREKDQTTPHQPLLSSLVIRPADSGGAGGAGSDYEPGEVRRDPPPYSRSDRYDGGHGYRVRAGSASPVRHRDGHQRFSPGFGHSSRGRGFGNGREVGRFRDYSPPYGRGKDRRFADRGFDRSTRGRGRGGPGPIRIEGLPRNNPNVQPREGDWVCTDPSCKNLNFARREHCNNCNRSRYAPVGSPRRGYPGPIFPTRQRFPGPPLDRSRSPGRFMNGGGGYRSPPRGWPRDGPRPPPRHQGRFPGDGKDYPHDDNRERPQRYDNRAMGVEWGHRERGRDNFFNDKRGYGRRALSPPAAPGGWAPHMRQRSRSPVRGGAAPPQRDMFMNRGRDDRRGGREEM